MSALSCRCRCLGPPRQPALARRPTAFFAVSASATSPDPAGRARATALAERFVTQIGWRQALTASFAGAVPYTRYGLFTRIVMRWIVGRAGGDTDTSRDFEYTDWSVVERFADDIAARLLARGHAPAAPPSTWPRSREPGPGLTGTGRRGRVLDRCPDRCGCSTR